MTNTALQLEAVHSRDGLKIGSYGSIQTVVSDELKKRIQVLFFEVGLDDKEILRVLQEEGFQIGKWALIRLRFELNLKRSIRTEEQQAQADKVVRKRPSTVTGKLYMLCHHPRPEIQNWSLPFGEDSIRIIRE